MQIYARKIAEAEHPLILLRGYHNLAAELADVSPVSYRGRMTLNEFACGALHA